MADHLPARRTAAPASASPADALALVRRQFSAEVAALEASPAYDAYLDAVQSVVVVLGLPATEAQVLAVCLALHDNDVPADDAAVLARVLRDDLQFGRDTVRYGAPMIPADWIAAWRKLPQKGARYSADDCRRFVRLGYPRPAFVVLDATPNAERPFGYVPTLADDAPALPTSGAPRALPPSR